MNPVASEDVALWVIPQRADNAPGTNKFATVIRTEYNLQIMTAVTVTLRLDQPKFGVATTCYTLKSEDNLWKLSQKELTGPIKKLP